MSNPTNSPWKRPYPFGFEEKPIWDISGNPNYTCNDLWSVYEGLDANQEMNVDHHILRVEDGFQTEMPPTNETVNMIYWYITKNGQQRILYTDGREKRFNLKQECKWHAKDMKVCEGIDRCLKMGYESPPPTYTHVRVYDLERDSETLEVYGWRTLIAENIKKILPVFTLSDTEMDRIWMRRQFYKDMVTKHPNININLFDFIDI